MTTTTINYQITLTPSIIETDTKLQQEEVSNHYWAEYCRRNAPGFNVTAWPLSPETAFKQPQNTLVSDVNIPELDITASQINQKNLRLIDFLDQWMAEPDDLGEDFWKSFCEDIEKNSFTI